MALVVPPPNDKKRVKVYELKNNDWFDRGTGFCTGRVVGVSTSQAAPAVLGGIIMMETHVSGYGLRMADSGLHRTISRSLLSRRISRSDCYWKRRLRRKMDIRSSKVLRFSSSRYILGLCSSRYPHSMDGIQRDGHGTKLSRSGGMRGDMVISAIVSKG